MSNEPTTGAPMSSEAVANEASPGRSSPRAIGGASAGSRPVARQGELFDADAELVLAALGRIVAKVRGERSTLDRLADALGEMADAIARAKTALPRDTAGIPAADSDVVALLNELEHRVDAMLDLIGGEGRAVERPAMPAPPPVQPAPNSEPAIADRVPTVSGVVSRLGGEEAPDDHTGAASAAAPHSGVPTVAMLEAMVEALNVSAPVGAPEAQSAPQTAEAEPAAKFAEVIAETIAEMAAETIAKAHSDEAAPQSASDEAMAIERELIVGYAVTAAETAAPLQAGTVVLFNDEPEVSGIAAVEPATSAETAEPSPEQEAPVSHPALPPLPTLELPEMMPAWRGELGPGSEAEVKPAEAATAPPAETIEPAPQPPPAASAGFDWITGLMQNLVEPAPPRTEHEQPSASAPTIARPAAAVSSAESKKSAADPLAALQALSPEEKIALFS